MNTIQNSPSTLAQSLANLSAQTQSAPVADDSSSAGLGLSGPFGADTLTLSSASSAADLDDPATLIEEQNRASVLADPASALAAAHSASALISGQPGAALSSQGSPSAANVLNLIADV